MRFTTEKIKTPDELARIVRALQAEGLTIVHCHGVFDLVHLGHVNYFEEAKKRGDFVYVGVIADAYVRKGPGRPWFSEIQRLTWVAALESVDYVVLNEEEGPWSLMRTIRPNLYTKGEDHLPMLADPSHGIHEDIRVMESIGGRVIFTPSLLIHSSDLFRSLGLERDR
ncbi:hypothetical protein A3E39_01190 [Candidatus Uhrbacteria bacterium RIFCSPHIGHO2_12_FULL_60_25]|uniref:Cytidyltransferase-like domain-containing protein n=1 Tax=Candidatus Uhrbacteria bacterium RIFCSPHIGHO2_12_FULL_60_25 TaxID=1802399 RepID=A0A1F7UM09_9BACT|nr:MAG: hypothetical protein A3D73_02295 [Candidatus Uhrbacteria bacterium RIFCSPHIGHO2_02_FULL_60_44]OGL78758.1 MAG: hypothetical protein A3E39_01190 [Candidatus Uhrbacteria bacterium RIFCSPHIGHO2_12_FULL_60_25]